MKQFVLITGSSSGIGRATALFFQRKGWHIVATMRSPHKESGFCVSSQPLCAVSSGICLAREER